VFSNLDEKMENIIRIDEQGKIYEIRPDGDVIVEAAGARMRVSSKYLASASNMLATILRGRAETNKLHGNQPSENLELTGDCSYVWLTLCCIIHHRNDLVQEIVPIAAVLQLAIGIRDYGLERALQYASAEWLKPRLRMNMMETAYLLAASMLVESEEMMKTHTTALILDYSDPYSEIMEDPDDVSLVLWSDFISR
jgi:hypothetical protein